eukprot:gene7764-9556_t
MSIDNNPSSSTESFDLWRIQLEDEYAKNLSKLVLKFEPTVVEGYIGSRLKGGWDLVRLETLSHSTHHESIFSNLQTHICEPIEGLIVDLEQKLKVINSDALKAAQVYQESVLKLRKIKQNYDKLCKESMEVTGVSKGETQKVQKRAIKAAQDVIKADKEYRGQINETNSAQTYFIQEALPKVMADLQRVETIRIHMVKSYFLRYFNSMDNSSSNNSNSQQQQNNTIFDIGGLIQSITNINNEEEIQEFIKRSKSNVQSRQLKPFEYEPYVDNRTYHQPSSPSHHHHHHREHHHGSRDINIGSSSSMGDTTPPPKDKNSTRWGLKRFSSTITLTDKKLSKVTVFNSKLDDLMNLQKKTYPSLEIPYVLVILKRKLMALDALKTQGIFRVNGNVIDINSIKKRFDDGNYEISANENVYTVASLLKLWLREISDPLIPVSMYDSCIQTSTIEQVLNIIQTLPLTSQRVISYIIAILQQAILPENVEASKMNSDNLAMVFSPCLLRSPYTDPNILLGNIIKEKEFIKRLIENLVPLSIEDSITVSDSNNNNNNNNMPPPQTTFNNRIINSNSNSSGKLNQSTDSPPASPLTTPTKSSRGMSGGSSHHLSSSDGGITKSIYIKGGGAAHLHHHLNSSTGGSSNNSSCNDSPNSSAAPTPSSTPTITIHPPTASPPYVTGSPSSSSSIFPKTPQTPASSLQNPPMSPPPHHIQHQPSTPSNTPSQTPVTTTSVIHPSVQRIRSKQLELLSPSEVKRRSNQIYVNCQESIKEYIDDLHTQINELYSDITTNQTSCYYAMKASLNITNFTKSLETHLIKVLEMSLPSVRDAIEENNFVSPPAIHFKIPSSLPKLSPAGLVESTPDLLRKWLINVTLTVNRANEFLCYYGGIVMRIYSPEDMESIQRLIEDAKDLRPITNPKFTNVELTPEQAELFIQRTLSLLDPLNPFTEEELNINDSVVTPSSFTPPSQQQDSNSSDEGFINSDPSSPIQTQYELEDDFCEDDINKNLSNLNITINTTITNNNNNNGLNSTINYM